MSNKKPIVLMLSHQDVLDGKLERTIEEGVRAVREFGDVVYRVSDKMEYETRCHVAVSVVEGLDSKGIGVRLNGRVYEPKNNRHHLPHDNQPFLGLEDASAIHPQQVLAIEGYRK